MREFFEAEAELSGSDEPSEDEEDGEDLDRMEEEEADAEQIDEERLREQVRSRRADGGWWEETGTGMALSCSFF